MQGFNFHQGIILPFDKINVDTDMLLPKQFLQKINKEGFGDHLFHELRYLDDNGCEDNPEFILNHPVYKKASILLTRDNFGCGSSREHAVWALSGYGFKVIIASSFGDIFYQNCFNNHILPIVLATDLIDLIFSEVISNPGISADIDLISKKIKLSQQEFIFELDDIKAQRIIYGLDEIGLTLLHEDLITKYEKNIPKFLQ